MRESFKQEGNACCLPAIRSSVEAGTPVRVSYGAPGAPTDGSQQSAGGIDLVYQSRIGVGDEGVAVGQALGIAQGAAGIGAVVAPRLGSGPAAGIQCEFPRQRRGAAAEFKGVAAVVEKQQTAVGKEVMAVLNIPADAREIAAAVALQIPYQGSGSADEDDIVQALTGDAVGILRGHVVNGVAVAPVRSRAAEVIAQGIDDIRAARGAALHNIISVVAELDVHETVIREHGEIVVTIIVDGFLRAETVHAYPVKMTAAAVYVQDAAPHRLPVAGHLRAAETAGTGIRVPPNIVSVLVQDKRRTILIGE